MRLSTRLGSDATRIFRGGRLTGVVEGEDGFEVVSAWQLPDGAVRVRAPSEAGVEQVRFVLGLDDDHSEFLRRFAGDPLLGRALPVLRGLRPLRVGTVAQALLRAVAGQLITARLARAIERRVVRAATPEVIEGLYAPPSRAALARFAPAQLRALGLGGRRAATLVRLCRALDLQRLRDLPTAAAADRLERERGLGPWSVGVVCLQGLGRFERGLVGDLGLIKLLAAMRGRPVDGWETAEVLEPYGEWAGLASVYLLAAYARGLVPVSQRAAA
jgi:3-methyladenine DNA glycosylase/8-oxoguanine DNA glycosylase